MTYMRAGQPSADTKDWLAHVPVTLFATVMGLAGFTLAAHEAETAFGFGHAVSQALLLLTVFDFLLIGGLYAAKALRHPSSLLEEWRHPVKLAFFPAISISMLLIAAALRPLAPDVAGPVWLFGAVVQSALTLAVISGWIGKRPFQPVHVSPVWFIPAVGNIVAPIAGVGLGYQELSWLFFSTGLLFWIVLLTLVMNRLVFHDPLPARLLPTLVILIAPPAVGFLAWLQLSGGQLDAPARLLFNAAVMFAAVVLLQAPGFARLPFALSWWALSFPLAALTIATLRYGTLTGVLVFDIAGGCLLGLLAFVVIGLSMRTLKAAAANQIFVPD